MLRQVADGVLSRVTSEQHRRRARPGRRVAHRPGVQGDEMATLANDLRELGQPVLTPGNHTLDVDGDDGLATGACRNGLRGSSESKTC